MDVLRTIVVPAFVPAWTARLSSLNAPNPARGRPYHLAGRSLRPSWAPLARMCLRSGFMPALVTYAVSMVGDNPDPPLFQLRRLRAPRVPETA